MPAEHRKPPIPPSFTVGLPWGTCRWCALLILRDDGTLNRRRRWHPDCLDEYFGLTDSGTISRNVTRRDLGVCAGCKTPHGHWEDYGQVDAWATWVSFRPEIWGVFTSTLFLTDDIEIDHIVPLWMSRDMGAEERLRFFQMDNLQSLCGPCHKRKTAREAAVRAGMLIFPTSFEAAKSDMACLSSSGESPDPQGL